jgi:hypothetical protein
MEGGKRNGLALRTQRKRPPTEAALPSDDAATLFTHELVISVDLARKSHPARGEISQNLGLALAARATATTRMREILPIQLLLRLFIEV